MTLIAEHEVTEEWRGVEEIIRKSLAIQSKISCKYDLCTDYTGPKTIMGPELIKQSYLDMKKRGVKIRLITEITTDNLIEAKEFMEIAEVRHLAGVRGSFVIADETDYAGSPETENGILKKLMVSNVGTFVKQQQYFFETLWENAMPAEHQIKLIKDGIDPERTEVWRDQNVIISRSLEILAALQKKYDFCIDWKGPSIIMTLDYIKNAYMDISARGGKIRLITEIIQQNISYCKAISKFAEVRHLEGIKGNFGIVDEKVYGGTSSTNEKEPLRSYLHSTVKEFVEQQQSFFEMLWNKAIPIEQRIRQLEEGTEPEITEVVSGWDNIFRRSIDNILSAKQRVDSCFDAQVPAIIVDSPMYKTSSEFVERGGKFRVVTEITAENLPSVRELMKIQEIRHIDGFKMNFGVSESDFTAPTSVYSASSNPQIIYSNSKDVIKEHQYLFETLWDKAVPADQRIRELELGVKPEKIELIQDTRKSASLAFEIMERTKEELLILFASPRTFMLGFSLGTVGIYDQMSKRGVNLRLLVPKGSQIENEVAKIKELNPSINVRISEPDLNTNITIMVADRKEFISWELKDDTLSDPYQAGGIATYSTIQSLATSYGTIFDNLWKITEFTENLREANIRLEKSEKSMKDFIDIAAHELRTPIQPIIGLTEVLRKKTKDVEQSELFDAITRNAERLQRLQEDILDVTKIENQLIRYEKEIFNIDDIITWVVKDIENSSTASGGQEILTDLQSNSLVEGDKQRIVQVMLNLIGNALKFTKNGAVTVRSRLKDDEVLVEVIDTGTGIDPVIMPKLFTKFATKSSTGTGLGLFISKSLVEGHGGKIWAENNSNGKGARFTFSLPISNKMT